MGVWIGLDIGSISVKLAAIGEDADRSFLAAVASLDPGFKLIDASAGLPPLIISNYRRVQGSPITAIVALLEELNKAAAAAITRCGRLDGLQSWISGAAVVGSGAKLVSEIIGAVPENEFKAIAKGMEILHPDVRTVFEMGGERSKFIRLEQDPNSGEIGIVDYETNGDCAAGTGSFIDQQALRLRYEVEEIGDVVLLTPTAASIAGRCSVFAKSDMVHAQQKGFTPAQILKGLCDAVARNFKASITKSKKIKPKVAFIGGVALNKGVAQSLQQLFNLSDADFFIPAEHAWLGAIGAAALMKSSGKAMGAHALENLRARTGVSAAEFPTYEPLSLENVCLLRDQGEAVEAGHGAEAIDAYLGIDIGSVSTNLAVIDDQGRLLKEIYLRTEGRPIEQVQAGLTEIEQEIGHKIRIRGAGTTGSGRELIGELIGADTVNDEITAHKTGAMYVSVRLTEERVDTIFEIGGQDSKFISIEDSVVVDFAMNEACAAGTGSFLEEQAEKLGVSIKGEFSDLALRSKHPIRLGERCTVFMEQDINSYMQKGAAVEDLVGGLAYAIALNYLNRVVRGRKIGEVIYFQGGTAYNDSVAAAFSQILRKRIIVPPHNGVIGAIGMALLASERMRATGGETKFRGYDLSKIHHTIKEFVCRACTNYCDMQEFNVEGEKTYWGDKCSDKFRKRAKVEKKPVIPDLIALRKQLLFVERAKFPAGKAQVGIPMTMSFWETFPFWNRFLGELGFGVTISEETNTKIARAGIDLVVAEPCYPIKVAHGHVMELFDRGVQYVLLPNVLDGECHVDKSESMLCPWNQTLPFVLRSAPRFEEYSSRLLMPTVHFKVGQEFVKKELVAWGKGIGLSRSACGRAVDRAYESQRQFQSQLLEAGSTALELLDKAGELGIVVVGRSYNIYDKSINLNIPSKLRDYYSVNVIPIDFLPVEQQSVADINDNMFWQSGRRILAAAKIVGQHANLHIVYITNFKCGPDSFIKHFITVASGRPFLSLQFDGHGNDAGFLTRCEAYLDSKGFLRSWMHDELIAHRRAAEQPGIGEQGLGIRETGRSL